MSIEKALELLESVKLLELKPGDALMFRMRGDLNDEQFALIKAAISKHIPGWPILVVDDSVIDLQVARRLEADSA